MFQGNMLPPFFGSKKKAGKKPASRAYYLAHASLFSGLLFDPENRGSFSEMMVDL
jgi:hypothetical protein